MREIFLKERNHRRGLYLVDPFDVDDAFFDNVFLCIGILGKCNRPLSSLPTFFFALFPIPMAVANRLKKL